MKIIERKSTILLCLSIMLIIFPSLVSCKNKDLQEKTVENIQNDQKNQHILICLDGHYSATDVNIYLDEELIGTGNATKTKILAKVSKGKHKIKISRSDKEDVYTIKEITVNDDMNVTCTPKISGKKVELRDISIISGPLELKKEMPDVRHLVIKNGLEILDREGFINVKYEDLYDYALDENIIIGMNYEPGKLINIDDEITLEYTSIKDYLNENYLNHNLLDVRNMAIHDGFIVTYKNADNQDMDEEIYLMNEVEASKWIITNTKYIDKYKVYLVVEQVE